MVPAVIPPPSITPAARPAGQTVVPEAAAPAVAAIAITSAEAAPAAIAHAAPDGVAVAQVGFWTKAWRSACLVGNAVSAVVTDVFFTTHYLIDRSLIEVMLGKEGSDNNHSSSIMAAIRFALEARATVTGTMANLMASVQRVKESTNSGLLAQTLLQTTQDNLTAFNNNNIQEIDYSSDSVLGDAILKLAEARYIIRIENSDTHSYTGTPRSDTEDTLLTNALIGVLSAYYLMFDKYKDKTFSKEARGIIFNGLNAPIQEAIKFEADVLTPTMGPALKAWLKDSLHIPDSLILDIFLPLSKNGRETQGGHSNILKLRDDSETFIRERLGEAAWKRFTTSSDPTNRDDTPQNQFQNATAPCIGWVNRLLTILVFLGPERVPENKGPNTSSDRIYFQLLADSLARNTDVIDIFMG
ncbi:MAG: hypothetical protein V4490_01100, partial [Pseudomonadota bacterium]